MKIIGYLIWNTAELFNISLGKFAPYIFGIMIGRFPHKKERSTVANNQRCSHSVANTSMLESSHDQPGSF